MRKVDVTGFLRGLDGPSFKAKYINQFNSVNSGTPFDKNNESHLDALTDAYLEYTRLNNTPSTNTEKKEESVDKNKDKTSYDWTPKFVQRGVTWSEDFIKGQMAENMPTLRDTQTTLGDPLTLLFDSEGKLKKLSEIGKNVAEEAFKQLGLYSQQQSALLTIINEKAGMTSKLADDFRETLTDANPRLEQLGIGFDELADSAKDLIITTGRFATINQQTWERAGEVAKAYVGTFDNLISMYPKFAEIGLGAADAQERIADAGAAALSVGLQAQKSVGIISNQLDNLNKYGFKKGIDGLAEMVRKSTELRMSMESVFTIAEKVMEPEGALELTANLQALGGAIGDFGNPLKLMYMATNNVEGLQDALKGAAGSLATYNSEQKRFEITGVNIRRAREMQKQLGIGYEDLTKGAIAAAERSKAAGEMAARGLQVSDKEKEFLMNIAQMKDGKMSIDISSSLDLQKEFKASTVAIEDLTQSQVNKLLDYQKKLEKKTPEDIIRDQATTIKNMGRDLNFIVALMRKTGGQTAEKLFKDIIGEVTGKEYGDIAKTTLNMTKEARGFIESAKGFSLEDIKNIKFSKQEEKKEEPKKPEPKKVKDAVITPGGLMLETPDGQLFESDKNDKAILSTSFDKFFTNQIKTPLQQPNIKNEKLETNNNDFINVFTSINNKMLDSISILSTSLKEKMNKNINEEKTNDISTINSLFNKLILGQNNFPEKEVQTKKENINNIEIMKILSSNYDKINDRMTNIYGSFNEQYKKIIETKNINGNLSKTIQVKETNNEKQDIAKKIEIKNINTPQEKINNDKIENILTKLKEPTLEDNTTKNIARTENKKIDYTFDYKFTATNGVLDTLSRSIMNSPEFISRLANEREFIKEIVKESKYV